MVCDGWGKGISTFTEKAIPVANDWVTLGSYMGDLAYA
jgi:hypothetical protein